MRGLKHPALTRVLAIVLVLLCLTMAGAGALGLSRAQKDRRSTLEEMQRLRGRIAEYDAVTLSLSGTESYEALSGPLTEEQKEHDKESAQHRSELSTFTATQYGIGMGTEAMDEADRQFAQIKAVFNRAMPVFEEGMAQADSLLGSLDTLYQTVGPILGQADAHLANAEALAAMLDSGELSYAQLVAAYDELLAMVDESAAMGQTLRGLEPTLDAIAAFDPESLTRMADEMSAIPESLGSFGSVPLDFYAENGVEVPFDLNQLVAMKKTYDQVWGVLKQGLALWDQAAPEAQAQLEQATGITLEELRAQAQAARDELAAHGDEPLDPEQSAALLALYNANREQILAALSAMGAGLAQLEGYSEQIGEGLSTVETQVGALKTLIGKAKAGIAAGEDALYQARAMIWLQMGLQREKEEELRRRKAELDEEAAALQERSEEADEQNTLEQQQKSLRMSLLSREEIQARVEAGEEPGEAALSYAKEREDTAEREYGSRRVACLLMLFGALYGLLGIPAAFEATKSRLMLTLPVLHCFGFAAGAEQILWKLGRGLSYSCLAVMLFALLQLLISRPKKKKRPAGQPTAPRHLAK